MNTNKVKKENSNLPIFNVMGSLFLLLLNTGGTIAWIDLYVTGRYTGWWVIALIIVCGLVAIMQLPKIYKWVKSYF